MRIDYNIIIFTVIDGIIHVAVDKSENQYRCFRKSLDNYNVEMVINNELDKLLGKSNAKELVGIYGEEKSILISYIVITNYRDNLNYISLDEAKKTFTETYFREAVKKMLTLIITDYYLKIIYPDGFTIPELQTLFERVEHRSYDRRNFHKKILKSRRVIPTGEMKKFRGKKPAKMYCLK